MTQIIIFNKPYGVLSQFTDSDGHPGLAGYIQMPGFYPAGRLDRDSEGLLLLTDNGPLQAQIAHPKYKLAKTYWVQVEGELDRRGIAELSKGVQLKDGLSKPATARIIPPPAVWDRTPPIRARKSIPTSWLELTISEGRNRQVRRMTAAVGFPTLRLIRYQIGDWKLVDLAPGQFRTETVDPAFIKPKGKSSVAR